MVFGVSTSSGHGTVIKWASIRVIGATEPTCPKGVFPTHIPRSMVDFIAAIIRHGWRTDHRAV